MESSLILSAFRLVFNLVFLIFLIATFFRNDKGTWIIIFTGELVIALISLMMGDYLFAILVGIAGLGSFLIAAFKK